MSYAITVSADFSELERLKKLLSHIPGAFSRAAKKAAGETIRAMKKTAGDEASKVYETTGAKVRKHITLYPSSGTLMARGRRMNLSDYRMTPKRVRNPQHGIRGSVLRSTGMRFIPRGFLMRGANSGKVLAMMRTGKGRRDIKPLVSPAVPQMLENEEVSGVLEEEAGRIVLEKLKLYVNRAVTEGR